MRHPSPIVFRHYRGIERKTLSATLVEIFNHAAPVYTWNAIDVHLPVRVDDQEGTLALRAQRTNDPMEVTYRIDVTGLPAATRAVLGRRLATEARAVNAGSAALVEGGVVVAFTEWDPRATAGVVDSTHTGFSSSVRTSERQSCLLPLLADIGQTGDTIVVASYGIPRGVIDCPSAIAPAASDGFMVPLRRGRTELRVQWRGGDDALVPP